MQAQNRSKATVTNFKHTVELVHVRVVLALLLLLSCKIIIVTKPINNQ